MTDTTAASAPSGEQPGYETGYRTKGYRAFVLSSLLLVYIFNFIDRSIINILTEPIKASFGVEDWQMGLLGGPAFAVLYTFLGIPIARYAERHHILCNSPHHHRILRNYHHINIQNPC